MPEEYAAIVARAQEVVAAARQDRRSGGTRSPRRGPCPPPSCSTGGSTRPTTASRPAVAAGQPGHHVAGRPRLPGHEVRRGHARTAWPGPATSRPGRPTTGIRPPICPMWTHRPCSASRLPCGQRRCARSTEAQRLLMPRLAVLAEVGWSTRAGGGGWDDLRGRLRRPGRALWPTLGVLRSAAIRTLPRHRGREDLGDWLAHIAMSA